MTNNEWRNTEVFTRLLGITKPIVAGASIFVIVFGLTMWLCACGLRGYGIISSTDRWLHLVTPPEMRASICWTNVVALSNTSFFTSGLWYWMCIWSSFVAALIAISKVTNLLSSKGWCIVLTLISIFGPISVCQYTVMPIMDLFVDAVVETPPRERTLPDCAGTDLVGADLQGVDLGGITLSKADLRGADLHEANLCDAYLNGADLRGADLRKADLRGANLDGANLHLSFLNKARYDDNTVWPEGSDPVKEGAEKK